MESYVLTVERADPTEQGLRLSPGIRPSETRDRPAIGKLIQGARLELRRPDGGWRVTELVTYGVSVWKGEDGSFYTTDDPGDPEIKHTLPEDLSPEDVPPGTEVWLLDGRPDEFC
jgi:hypothetical protein